MAQSMDVDDTNDNSNDAKPKEKESEYQLSVQLSMHTSPARCVVAIDNDTIVSGGRKEGEFIIWKRVLPPKSDPSDDDDNDEKMDDVSTLKFDGSLIFTEDNFHPLTFCAAKTRVKFDPPRVVSGGSDQRAVIWDINGNIYQQLSGHSNSVNSVDVTDDGRIVTGSYDSTAKLWDADGKCIATMQGHEHGVEVCSLESGQLVTGTFKLFHIWSPEGQLQKTIKNAHDHMIRKVRRHPLGFLTAANDGYVNLWSNTGESIRKVLAHPENGDIPSFVYGLYTMDNGNWISCGEDGTVKIFSADGFLQQALRHPGAVWDVTMLPNGDIVTACADATVRVWSRDATRQMDEEAVKEYYSMLQMAKQVQKGGQVDQSQLEDVSVLKGTGKPGEFKMVDHPEKGPSVWQWDGASATWQYIGEIMGKPGGNDGRPQINGVHYDFVTHIDTDQSEVQIPLGFNKDDDPRQISRDFCTIHGIDLDNAQTIEAHLRPMADPLARAARLERERMAAAKKLRHIPSFKKCEYEIQGKCKLDAMKKKLVQFNTEILNSDDAKDSEYKQYGVEDAADLDDLFGILSDQSNWHVAKFPQYCCDLFEHKLLHWPTSKVLPVLDMMRMFMLHQDAVDLLITKNENIRELITGHIGSDECSAAIQMIVSRLLSNYLAKRKRAKEERLENKYPVEILEFLQEALSLMSAAATNQKSSVHTAYIMLAHNTLIWFGKFKVEEADIYLIIISAMFELMTELKLNDKILYYCLSLIGTCAWASKSAKGNILEIFGEQLKGFVEKAKHSATSAACKEVGNDLWNLFEMS